MTDTDDADNNAEKVAQQITDILGKHVSYAINPAQIFVVLGKMISAHICTVTINKDDNLKSFRKMLKGLSDAYGYDDEPCPTFINWKTNVISRDAEYDCQGAALELSNLFQQYVNENTDRYWEVYIALGLTLIGLMHHSAHDENGFIPPTAIDESMDWIEKDVYCRD
jgi:hypothetical protein